MTKGYVHKIIPFSAVDGPGNRMVIFLQGCNFNCIYCHNPETIHLCNHCGICSTCCPYSALDWKDGKVDWNQDLCQHCDHCIKACPHTSSPKVREMNVEEVISQIQKVRPFISGITVSGGECTLQIDFVKELFKKAKDMGLTTFLDTNGFVSMGHLKILGEDMDMAMVDLKAWDVEAHEMLTGQENTLVLQSIRYLAAQRKLYEVRTVIVPALLDNHETVQKTGQLLAMLDPDIRYKLIRFRPIGVRKEAANLKEPSDELMEDLMDLARKEGCKHIIIV
ncbi:YjjW family glycine radical enzyme activase [Anaerosolibacter carboniphilus]|uniref:YjjW family glycine radical enzyme activase n=2 Tax=Anaerosolibacter carboniphilus TaxID=1417629 RepID=A0A841KUR0_9FIRM|nr:YjjW family glycine radical enzyme activase [Anaerosolibacter carboniphilus]MBB6217386.1 YjjW family glycine radical enzyme activase [Anaerosolibacter carboniphilus]